MEVGKGVEIGTAVIVSTKISKIKKKLMIMPDGKRT